MTRHIRIITLLVILITTLKSIGQQGIKGQSEKAQVNPITVEKIGKGKPIIYLPGFTTPGSIWEETVESLGIERESYLFSYAGFNGSEPIEFPWYPSIKNAIIKYIKDENMTDIIIIGHSMGGNLAVDIAFELPHKVSKIVLADALPCMRELMMPNVPAKSLFYESPYNKQMLEMGAEQFNNMAAMMATNMTFNPEKKILITKWISEADRKTWVYGYTDLLKLDLRDKLSTVKCESLILGASFPDVKIAKETFESQYSNLANKTIKMASNSKHFLMLDQPEWFYQSLKDFIVDEKK